MICSLDLIYYSTYATVWTTLVCLVWGQKWVREWTTSQRKILQLPFNDMGTIVLWLPVERGLTLSNESAEGFFLPTVRGLTAKLTHILTLSISICICEGSVFDINVVRISYIQIYKQKYTHKYISAVWEPNHPSEKMCLHARYPGDSIQTGDAVT